MKLPGSKKKKTKTVSCPRCNSPVSPDTAFCENCGARIGLPPACSLCGTLLAPNSRFCPSCGTMVGHSKDNLPDNPESPGKDAAPVKKTETSRVKKLKIPEPKVPAKDPDPLMMIPEPGEPDTPSGTGDMDQESLLKKKVPVPSALVTIPPQDKPHLLPAGFGKKTRAIIAVFVILMGIIALALTGLLPVPAVFTSSGGHTTPPVATTETPVILMTSTTAIPEAAPAVIPVATTMTPSLLPGPTQEPPENFLVYFQAERDPISKMVSVLYMGGKGQMGVRDVFVRLTRSDGQVLTGTFKPAQIGTGITLQGTEKVDRVEVIVHYHTGDEYTVIDRIFEYKIRN